MAAIEQVRWLGPLVAVLGGLLLGLSPFAWPVMAVSVAGSTGVGEDRHRPAPTALAIGLGLTVVYASLGLVTGDLDRVVRDVFARWAGPLYLALAATVAAAGVALLVRPAASCRVGRRRPMRPATAVLVGLPLGVVNCPACAGVVTGVALAGGAAGDRWYAVVVMAAFGLGHTAALLVGAHVAGRAAGSSGVAATTVSRVGGALLLAVAAFFVFQAVAGGIGTTGPVLP
jgi:cytochrome c biogenesis protein CcdA